MFLYSVILTVKIGVGDMAKISYHIFFFEISQFHTVDFTIMSEQCSQNNFHIIKTNPFKVTKY